jgi:hypothetical protein
LYNNSLMNTTRRPKRYSQYSKIVRKNYGQQKKLNSNILYIYLSPNPWSQPKESFEWCCLTRYIVNTQFTIFYMLILTSFLVKFVAELIIYSKAFPLWTPSPSAFILERHDDTRFTMERTKTFKISDYHLFSTTDAMHSVILHSKQVADNQG